MAWLNVLRKIAENPSPLVLQVQGVSECLSRTNHGTKEYLEVSELPRWITNSRNSQKGKEKLPEVLTIHLLIHPTWRSFH